MEAAGLLVTRYLSSLEEWVATVEPEPPSVTPTPPPKGCQNAAKGLRKLVEANPAVQEGLAAAAVAALFAPGGAAASALCATVAAATRAIDAIDVDSSLDPAACGLLPFGHLRVNALTVLVHMASTEQRCRDLLAAAEEPTRGAAAVGVDVLSSAAARTDLEGVRQSATLLRNLAMPAPNRQALASAGAFSGLCRHVAHRDPNTAAVCAAALRMLVEATPANAVRYVAASAAGGPFAPILELDLRKTHPHARVELARFVCLTIAGAHDASAAAVDASTAGGSSAEGGSAAAALDAPGLLPLATQPAVEFGAFLLASKHVVLHREACAALRAAHAIWQAHGDGASPLQGVLVNERPLRAVLEGLLKEGALAPAEVEGLIS